MADGINQPTDAIWRPAEVVRQFAEPIWQPAEAIC